MNSRLQCENSRALYPFSQIKINKAFIHQTHFHFHGTIQFQVNYIFFDAFRTRFRNKTSRSIFHTYRQIYGSLNFAYKVFVSKKIKIATKQKNSPENHFYMHADSADFKDLLQIENN